MTSNPIVIGIDLGTTNSCVSCLLNGNLGVLENSDGQRTTPSFIFFCDDGKAIVGKFAMRAASKKPQNGIYEVKRLMGRTFNDVNLQDNLKYFPFRIDDVANKPLVYVEDKEEGVSNHRTPEQLSSFILKKLKTDAEEKLGQTIDNAVITVPAYFNDPQRKATLEAARLAGFNVLKLLNEPTAAALNYFYDYKDAGEGHSLVYDLGGGTFDVAILKHDNANNIEAIAVDGDSHLGGHDFDNCIVEYLLKELETKFNCLPRADPRSMRRLRNESIKAKEMLSSENNTTIFLEGFFKRNDVIDITLSRQIFEQLADELFKRTVQIMDGCLKTSRVDKSQIRNVILAGGSTRIPKIQAMITQYFDGKKLNKFVNPDECVAKGAALQAAMLGSHPEQNIQAFNITEVTPLSIGTSVFGALSVVIPRNTRIPATQTKAYSTVINNQQSVRVDVYEGERADVRKNYYLGECHMDNLTPGPPGHCTIFLQLKIDENNILSVRAEELAQDNTRELTVTLNEKNDDAKIINAIRDAAANKEEDDAFYAFAKKCKFLTVYCEAIIYNLEEKSLTEEHADVFRQCKLYQLLGASSKLGDDVAIDDIINEITEMCSPLVDRYSFADVPDEVEDIRRETGNDNKFLELVMLLKALKGIGEDRK